MKKLDDTQFMYTPDPGVVQHDVLCGVCGTICDVTRGVKGPRSYVQSITGESEMYDLFLCPYRYARWHEEVLQLRRDAQGSVSEWLRKALYAEADGLLQDAGMKTDKKPE